MKTKLSALVIICSLLALGSCLPGKVIKGDGNVITKTIPITDYSKLQAAGSITINYSQSDEEPFLQVTTDENILEVFEFTIEDGSTLRIRPKKEYRRNTVFRPTEFTINTNSRKFEKAEVAGSTKFNANSPLQTDRLSLSLAGNGEINLNGRVDAAKVTSEIAGSATLNAHELFCNDYKGSIAGSGTLNLGGATEKAVFEIAGSGDVRAFDFRIENMKCEIAGSGDIEAYVDNRIDVNVAGSGRVKYKGNATDIKRSIAGSGSVKKVDD